MPVTLRDIARAVDKSITTVSRALNGYDDVSEETRDLILSTAEQMGYFPNKLAQRLQKQKTNIIGLILPISNLQSSDPYINRLLYGIGNEIRRYGYDLLVSLHDTGEEEMQAYYEMVQGQLVDGFILTRTRKLDPRIEYLHQQHIPFISFGRSGSDSSYPFIEIDGRTALEKMVSYLVGLGHKRIACITTDPRFNFTNERLAGFMAGCHKHGITIPEEFILFGGESEESGFHCTSQLLNLKTRPSAIVTFNDQIAYGAATAIQNRGLIVGRDISITGFDDLPLSAHFNPPLTTITHPVLDVAKRIGQMIVKEINNELDQDNQIMIEPELVIRKTSSPPPEMHPNFIPGENRSDMLGSIRQQLSTWISRSINSGFEIDIQSSDLTEITFQTSLSRVIFPNREGEWIESVETLPGNFEYFLTYPGTASTKSMALYISENEGIFIGAKPTTAFARISIRKTAENRFSISYLSSEHNLLFLPFDDHWKEALPTYREHYQLQQDDPIPSDPFYMLQLGINRPGGECEINHFKDLLAPYELFRKIMGSGHIAHFFGANQSGFHRMYPDLIIDPRLGGENALSAMLTELKAMGFKTSHHFNPRLADYDWVNNNRIYRPAIVRDEDQHLVIEDITGHPYYVMNPNHQMWQNLCFQTIKRLQSLGFDYIQLDQFTQYHNFNTANQPMHNGFQNLVARLEDNNINYWLEGLSDLYHPKGIDFSQIFVKKKPSFWTDGEPRSAYFYGVSYPDFFMSLYPQYHCSYRIVGEDQEAASIQRNLKIARQIGARIYDLQMDFYSKDYQRRLRDVIGKLRILQ
ncbi:MAG: LacI family DNA-binding transcriptional regulator [Anaerolineaceae bacterium]|nr:LacI family DNA-binding transcriptional regulator [Anaerolineaceae bacterium]